MRVDPHIFVLQEKVYCNVIHEVAILYFKVVTHYAGGKNSGSTEALMHGFQSLAQRTCLIL